MTTIPPDIIAQIASFADVTTVKALRAISRDAKDVSQPAFRRTLETFTLDLEPTGLNRAEQLLSRPHPLQEERDGEGNVIVKVDATMGSLVKQMVIVLPYDKQIRRSYDRDPRLQPLASHLTKVLNHVPNCRMFRFLLPENASADVAIIAMEKARLSNKFMVFDRIPCDPRNEKGEIDLDVLTGRNGCILDIFHRTVDEKLLGASHVYLLDHLVENARDITVFSLDMKWDTVDASAMKLMSALAKMVHYPQLEQLRIRAQAWRDDNTLSFVLKHKSTLERLDIDAAAGDGEEEYLHHIQKFLAGIKTTFMPPKEAHRTSPRSKGKKPARPDCAPTRPLQHFSIEFYVPKGDKLIDRSIQWSLEDVPPHRARALWTEAFEVMDGFIARGLAELESGVVEEGYWGSDNESD